ncbi:hypothetical protein FKP32DRAFT_1603324 [Trametes sanguinea]|nr:hypothetical protein FKP32DRAFT_1603324 [Trametes sanguinea]
MALTMRSFAIERVFNWSTQELISTCRSDPKHRHEALLWPRSSHNGEFIAAVTSGWTVYTWLAEFGTSLWVFNLGPEANPLQHIFFSPGGDQSLVVVSSHPENPVHLHPLFSMAAFECDTEIDDPDYPTEEDADSDSEFEMASSARIESEDADSDSEFVMGSSAPCTVCALIPLVKPHNKDVLGDGMSKISRKASSYDGDADSTEDAEACRDETSDSVEADPEFEPRVSRDNDGSNVTGATGYPPEQARTQNLNLIPPSRL